MSIEKAKYSTLVVISSYIGCYFMQGSIESARNDNENLHRMIGDLSRSAISTENEVKEKNAKLFSLQQERTKLLERRDSLEQELQTLRAQLDRSATEIAALSVSAMYISLLLFNH